MNTIRVAFVAAVLMIAAYWLYMVSDYIVLWSRRVMYLAGLGVRVCGGTFVFVVFAASLYFFIRQWHEGRRMRDGAHERRTYYLHPWHVRAIMWLIGRVPPRVEIFPETLLSPGVVISGAGVAEIEPRAGWDRQLAYARDVERTNRVRAAAPGDGALGLPWFSGGGAARGLGRMLGGGDAAPRPVMVDAPPPAALPQLSPPTLTPQAAIAESRPASLVLGQTDAGELVRWDMAQTPHLRFHGATQGAGKTNAIQTVAAGALRTGAHVVVFDPARFKDWGDFRRCAELVDASDPAALADGAARLMTIYHNRTRQLAAAGGRNIGALARPPQRIVVVICEFGAQCELARAEGVMGEIETRLLQLARKAAAAGIHLVLEDQAVERWPRALSANVAGVAVGRMPLYAAQACGFVARRGMTTETLERGQFWFGGQLLRTPHMQPELRALLASVPAPRRLVMQTPRWEGAGKTAAGVPLAPGTAGEGGVPPVLPLENAGTERDAGTLADDAPGRWDDVVAAWFAANPQALTGPAQGISDLARAMCRDAEGNDANYANYKGRAHPLFHEFRKAVRLPNGDRLGTDITGGDQ